VLETYLTERVHEVAVRERARRESLHRAERNLGASPPASTSRLTGMCISVDDAWMHALSTLHPPQKDTAAQSAAYRHEAAHHIGRVARRRSYGGALAAAVGIAAIMLIATWWLGRRGDEALRQSAQVSSSRIVTTRDGQRASTTLEDGSRVMVGAATTLQVPEEFGNTDRSIELDGTAAFTIAAGSRPFVVKAAQLSIVADSASFAVRAYGGEGRVVIRVDDGEVELRTKTGARVLAAGERLVVYGDGGESRLSERDGMEALGWTTGTFLVERRPLRQVLPELARWFKLEFDLREPALLDRLVTLEVGLDSPRAVVEALETGGRLRVVEDRSTLAIHDGAR
jgi:ferric-dicitrate binding protein FerR (iron transport regulator)